MSNTMYAVYPHDSIFFIFRIIRNDKLTFFDEYADLACKKCGKIDESVALRRGIQNEVVVKSKRPLLGSSDYLYLVNERIKESLSIILPDELDFFPVPSLPFYVAFQKVLFQPDETNPGFRFVNGRCRECGRPREVVWGKEPPTVPGPTRFLAVNLEDHRGARPIWLVSKDIADQFDSLKLRRGVALLPKEVNHLPQ